MENKKNKFGLWSFLLFSAVIFIISSIIVPIIITKFVSLEIIQKNNIYISSLLQIIIVGGFAKFIAIKQNISLKCNLKKTLRQSHIIIFLSLFAFITSKLLIDGIRWIYIGITDDFDIYTVAGGMNFYVFFLSLIFFAIIPSIFEEAFYRVSAYSCLKRNRSSVIILVSTICFSLSHIPAGWDSVISSLFLGVVLMTQYKKDQDYLFVVLTHFLFNAISLFFTHIIFWFSDCIYISSRASSGTECIFWGLVYTTISLLICTIPFIYSIFTSKNP